MSITREFAGTLEALANETRQTFTEAENKYRAAADRLDYARRTGANALEMAKVNVAYEEATAARNKVRSTTPDEVCRKIDSIRAEMVGAFASKRQLDPGKVDQNTMELLKLPDITAAEMKALAEKAISEDNPTMLRVIISSARQKLDAMGEHRDRETALQLTQITAMKDKYTVAEAAATDTFDAVAKIITSGMRDPEMFALSEKVLQELLEKLK